MDRSRFKKSRGNTRRWQVVAVVGVAVTITGVGLGVASAAEAVPTVNCPQVVVGVAVPAQAKAEVDRNLALLATQIDEANKRIASTVGQGGDNFIQNAILGPLKDKRFATINRIETAIGRNADKPNLNAEGLSPCSLNEGGGEDTNAGGGNNNGGGATAAPAVPGANLGILTNSCDTSNLEAHDGFQKGNRCVSTEFGEVGAAANNPTLLITSAPNQVRRNQAFTLKVSTRNLIRDRFLAAGQGGYYVESSVLANGLVRGHFHTACRMLGSTRSAPDPAPAPAFFVATEDGQGGSTPDTITIQVPGLPDAGTAQCSSWAGDGSHRIPMMERANQTPALDSVRIRVR
ncbi:hypothetical protein FB565_000402 [Actinoplanes lutulentus]|uniref:Uncharacterized protein n=1 Tax=Actinoplanes lutulentus TaxID=1287878 RepID=A0A327ZK12_9ACTN|nr:hypothetical protein [Actinoplanes lutulentus]MBB2940698.1 hypothetical protein [Actinoplanes lutulentus]RAK43009.1 hypothetical protein B0I29_101139 [Actinoplanes lutulentus]